ncbi:BTAD domain-containing putative transcriptional regulator [Kribbella sp. DT2]|uniref:BTAD domain-containing putative transcriptional regulator n=1 Tax=Kribbella sp. DT2 TaxID=3393427 RepID=UPI003CE6947A
MFFDVLGPLVVRTDAGEPVTVPDTKVRVLLLDLLVHRGRAVSAERLVDDVWGDQPPRNALGTLQARVSQLRTALERAEPGGRALVSHGPAGYTLQVPAEVVDSNKFGELLRGAASSGRRVELLREALGLWRGTPYAEVVDHDFARAARDRLEEQRLTAVEDLLDASTDGDPLGELAELVRRHPLRERLRAIQLRALYRAGRQDEALKAYDELRRALAEELGADPGPELSALHQAILRHDPALLARPEAGSAGGVPAPLNDLIGRETALADARGLLSTARLVTLVGPGGVGKTRLALETARELAEQGAREVAEQSAGQGAREVADQPAAQAAGRAARVRWVELAAVRRDEVLDAVATGVGLRDDLMRVPEPKELGQRLVESLTTRDTLLVLDNCEHLLERVADLVGRLLAGVPGLRVLATSREPLGIGGEHLLEVSPLAPAPAAELFRLRAEAGAAQVDDPEAVAAICRRLDGIPLALELAATRVRALGVRGLAERLVDRFRLLAGGRGVPERQRTLRATIDWSWELLSEDERTMLRRLAVHADSFSLEAAAEVSELPDDLVVRLVDRSLVVPTAGRYRLLESVGAYSLERLVESGEEPRLRRRHAAYYVSLAEQAEPHLRGPGQQQWLETLDHEVANVRAALHHASAEQALRLVNAMAWYWYLRGRLGEGRRALAAALAVPGPATAARAAATVWSVGLAATASEGSNLTEASDRALALYEAIDDPHGLARAEWFLASTQWAYGERDVLMARVNRSIDTFTRLNDRWGLAAALSTRAQLALVHVDLDGLHRDGVRSLELFDQLGDAWGRLQANYSLIMAAEISGDYPTARRRLLEALRAAEDLGSWTEVSFRTSGLGRIALLTGDYAQADELHERARRLALEQSNKSAEEYAVVGLGLSARWQGRLDEAEQHLTTLLDWLQKIDGVAGIAFIVAQLGFIAEQRGDFHRAEQLHLEARAAAESTGDERAVALTLEGLAGAKAAAALAGKSADLAHQAAVLLAEAERRRQAVGVPLPASEQFDVRRIRAAISRAKDS